MSYQSVMTVSGGYLDQSQRYRITVGAMLLGILVVTAGCAGQYVMGILGGGTLAYHVLERERFVDEETEPVMSLPVNTSAKSSFEVNRLSLDVPAGALEHDATVTVQTDTDPPDTGVTGLTAIGEAYRITPSGLAFDPPATVAITYDEASLPASADEIQLHVWRYDPLQSKFLQLPRAGGSSVTGNTVSAELYGSGWVMVMTSMYPTILSGVALTRSSVKLTFDLELARETAEAEVNYVIMKGAVDESPELIGPPSGAALSGDRRSVTLTLPESMDSDTVYTFMVSDVESVRGYEVDPNSSLIEVTGDWDAPEPITTLEASAGPGSGEVVLTWAAPHENGTTGGSPASYLVRYASSSITSGTWDAAFTADGAGTPRTPGATETMIVSGLAAGETYYFAVRTLDDAGLIGDVSNSPSSTPIP